jgi:uncharacterized Zn-binding protein involved in type VI secretion
MVPRVLRKTAMRSIASSVAALTMLAATTASCAADLPPNVGKTVMIDGSPMSTDGKIVTIDGNRILFDGKPVVIDGKPLLIDGHNVQLDGRDVVRNGKWLTQPAMLVFTIDTRWLGATQYRMERDVTTPIERAVKTLPGVIESHANIVGSRAQVELFFPPSTDAASTAFLIRTRLDQIKYRLPRDASTPLVAWRRLIAAPTGSAVPTDEE